MSIATIPPAGSALPTHMDLPYKDDKPVDNSYQPLQSFLLTGSLVPWLDRIHPGGDFYIGADNGIYWRLTQPPLNGCKAPDWFYVPDVTRLLDGEFRRSYVLWQEKKPPVLVIEYVSGNGSEERDETPESGKYWVYERAIQAAVYVIWDPTRLRLDVFELVRGRYQPMSANSRGRFVIPQMKLEFGVWEGSYQGCPAHWLRAWDLNGSLLPTAEERGDGLLKRVEQEKQRAEQEKQRAEKMAARLRELGVDPSLF